MAVRQTRKTQQSRKPRECFFCKNINTEIDYKDVALLRRFISSYGKIAPRKRSGVCASHQRKLSLAIKRARIMALLPFVIQ
ncbi:30S ribosomal protein S18 [Candidatus Uhrbacteria bacterium]|nr:30S ribosomal protein S18 [Candidatus Uhrbacteria bacterium]